MVVRLFLSLFLFSSLSFSQEGFFYTDTLQGPENPFQLYRDWKLEEEGQPETAFLSTVANEGGRSTPSSRAMIIELNDSQDVFFFHTNKESIKNLHLSENPQAHLCFYWVEDPTRQIRVTGQTSALSSSPYEKRTFKLNGNVIDLEMLTYRFTPASFLFETYEEIDEGSIVVSECLEYRLNVQGKWEQQKLPHYVYLGTNTEN